MSIAKMEILLLFAKNYIRLSDDYCILSQAVSKVEADAVHFATFSI